MTRQHVSLHEESSTQQIKLNHRVSIIYQTILRKIEKAYSFDELKASKRLLEIQDCFENPALIHEKIDEYIEELALLASYHSQDAKLWARCLWSSQELKTLLEREISELLLIYQK